MIEPLTQLTSPCRYQGFTRHALVLLPLYKKSDDIDYQYQHDLSDKIIKLVYKKMDADILLLDFKSRKREFVEPRRISIYLCMTCSQIGCERLAIKFNIDHSTVLYHEYACDDLYSTDANTKKIVNEVIAELKLTKKPVKIKY